MSLTNTNYYDNSCYFILYYLHWSCCSDDSFLWKVFTKANQPGWAAIVPIYNLIVMLEIAKKPTWWVAMYFVPIANIVFMIMTLNGISKNFGKDEGFTVGLVFLGFVFWPMLAFGDARYIDNTPTSNTDLLDS